MKNLIKAAAIAVFATVVFATVFLMLLVTFEFKSWDFVADNGVSLSISYSANRPVTVTLTGPDNQVVDQAVFSAGDGSGQLKMSQGENSPAAGVYMITMECLGRKIYENYLGFSGPYLGIENINVNKWGKKDNLSTIENVSLGLANSGDLPVYVYRVVVVNQPAWDGTVRGWIVPGRKYFSWNWSEAALPPGRFSSTIRVEGSDGNFLPMPTTIWMVSVPTVEETPEGENAADTWSGTVTAPGWHVIDTRGVSASSSS
jgi:hypothetical protein